MKADEFEKPYHTMDREAAENDLGILPSLQLDTVEAVVAANRSFTVERLTQLMSAIE